MPGGGASCATGEVGVMLPTKNFSRRLADSSILTSMNGLIPARGLMSWMTSSSGGAVWPKPGETWARALKADIRSRPIFDVIRGLYGLG